MSTYDDYINEKEIPVIVADENGVITHINQIFSETFLWLYDDVVGMPLMNVIPPNLQDAHNMGFSRYKISNKATILDISLDLEILKADGTSTLAQHFISAIEKEGKQYFAAKISLR